jgi:hypothetical protein
MPTKTRKTPPKKKPAPKPDPDVTQQWPLHSMRRGIAATFGDFSQQSNAFVGGLPSPDTALSNSAIAKLKDLESKADKILGDLDYERQRRRNEADDLSCHMADLRNFYQDKADMFADLNIETRSSRETIGQATFSALSAVVVAEFELWGKKPGEAL